MNAAPVSPPTAASRRSDPAPPPPRGPRRGWRATTARTVLSLVALAGLLAALNRGAGPPATGAAGPRRSEPAVPPAPEGLGRAPDLNQSVAPAPASEPTPAPPLPDPGVAPGACRTVTYTPPTAHQPFAGELCRPATATRDVAIIIVHGGSGVGGSYRDLRPWARRYLAEGYVTFLPEYHLFVPGAETPVFPWPEANIKAAVQYLRGTAAALHVSADRIVVQGHSAGARIGAVAYTTPDDPWFAGPELYAAISTAVDGFIGFYHPYDGTMQYADQYFGAPGSVPAAERRRRADSLSRAAAARGPALFVTGSLDWSLIAEQQSRFAESLQRRGLPARSVIVPGGAHGFDESGAGLSSLGEQAAGVTLAFLAERFPTDGTRPPSRPAGGPEDAEAADPRPPSSTGRLLRSEPTG